MSIFRGPTPYHITQQNNKRYQLQPVNITGHTYLLTFGVSARGHSDTPDVIMTLVSYLCGLPGLARKARKQ